MLFCVSVCISISVNTWMLLDMLRSDGWSAIKLKKKKQLKMAIHVVTFKTLITDVYIIYVFILQMEVTFWCPVFHSAITKNGPSK